MSKVFKDPIHKSISLPSYCVDVIDTPEFQRLRNIKQLTAESVYPGATHNRFAHSIGVCYLANQVIQHLKREQPDLLENKPDGLDVDEEKCVLLAALCHDMGHGPLSHKFEAVAKDLLPPTTKWKHEDASDRMLRYMIAQSKKEELTKLTPDEINLISDLILGNPPKNAEEKRKDHYKERRFLYQIVANKDNGVDVDKWDYFTRDCHYLGLANNFDHQRIIPFMRVCECERQEEDISKRIVTLKTQEICYRDKLIRDLSAMFATRWDLHDRAYQHRVVKLVEAMYADAIRIYLAKDAEKESPEFGAMTEIIEDMSIYSRLDDHIIGTISNSDVKEAKKIITSIKKRELYQCIGEILDADRKNVPNDDEIKKLLKANQYCSQEDLVIINHKYDYGMKSKNPLKYIYFYTKDDNKKGIILGDEKMPPTLPDKIQLRDVRLYTRAKVPKEDLPSLRSAVEEKVLLAHAKQAASSQGTSPKVPKMR